MQLFSGKSVSLEVSETRLKSKLYSHKMQTKPSTFTRLWEIHYIFTQCTYTGTYVLIYMYIYFLSWYHTFKFYKDRAISNSYITVIPASGTRSLHNRCTISSARFTSALCNSSKLRVTANLEGKETSWAWEIRKSTKVSKRSRKRSIRMWAEFFICQNFGQEETLFPRFPLCLCSKCGL